MDVQNDSEEGRSILTEDSRSIKAEDATAKRESAQLLSQSQKREHPRCSPKTIEVSSQVDYKEEMNEVIQHPPTTIDLNKQLLSGLVKHCRQEGLVSQELAHCFFTNYTTKIETQYIQCYKTDQLYRFPFAKCKINIVDHRRLLNMLVQHDPNKYLPPKPEGPYDFLKEGREFLKELYLMPLEEYQHIIDEQVNRYYQTWWGGPENPNPSPVEPIVDVLDVDEASKQRQQQEIQERNQRIEKEQQMMRISQNIATKADLENIAKKLSGRLFGRLNEAEVKQEEEEQIYEESEDTKHKKQKKDKKDKNRKRSKKKKDKGDQDVKKEYIEEAKAKKEVQDGQDIAEHPNINADAQKDL